jgi:hypothetical protein
MDAHVDGVACRVGCAIRVGRTVTGARRTDESLGRRCHIVDTHLASGQYAGDADIRHGRRRAVGAIVGLEAGEVWMWVVATVDHADTGHHVGVAVQDTAERFVCRPVVDDHLRPVERVFALEGGGQGQVVVEPPQDVLAGVGSGIGERDAV